MPIRARAAALRRKFWLYGFILIALSGILFAVDLVTTWIVHAPRIEALATAVPEETSYMRRAARGGHPPRDREWTPLAGVAPVAACAVIVSEDAEFFNIGTLNYQIQRVLLERMLHGDFSRGGSGFAQQLARNLFLGPQRTMRRKAREYLLAWQLSHALAKDRQLELYLNLVEWADGVWGIGAASRHYFGIAPSQLKPSQAVVLATMLPAPRRGLARGLSWSTANKQLSVLRRLAGTGLIDDMTRESTADRLGLWRAAAMSGVDPADAGERADRMMGPEPPAHALVGTDRRPLSEACQARRRPN